ncbi:hypothetical protein KUCAC02_028275, partial [Chaenocephalus aceratus]
RKKVPKCRTSALGETFSTVLSEMPALRCPGTLPAQVRTQEGRHHLVPVTERQGGTGALLPPFSQVVKGPVTLRQAAPLPLAVLQTAYETMDGGTFCAA